MGLTPAERQRRSRAHRKGDHSLCDPERCVDVTPPVTEAADLAVTEPVTDPVTELMIFRLGRRGTALFQQVIEEHPDLGPRQRVLLEEAARAADRLDTLDRLIRGDAFVWALVDTGPLGRRELVVDRTLGEVRSQQAILARLLSELRQSLATVADKPATGAAPAAPPAAGGKAGGGKVVSLRDRVAAARAAASG